MKAAQAYDEILDFLAAGTTPESIVSFRPSEYTQRRVQDLVDRRSAGCLSREEEDEFEEYFRLEHSMIMAKARARVLMGTEIALS